MGQTVIRFGDPKAVKHWSARLFNETDKQSYWNKFEGVGENNIIQRKSDLEKASGDRISFDLSVKLRGKPTSGDNRLKGKEEALKFFTDEVIIDQLRHGVSAGGAMTRKRTEHDMRTVAKDRLADYWAKYMDEIKFIYMSGARGINEDFNEDIDYAGHAGNPLRQPDAAHLLFGGSATSKATLTANDKMTRSVIERAANKADMMQARDKNTTALVPIKVGAEDHFIMLMSPDQEFDLRNADAGGWLEIQKAAAAAEGKNNPIFRGGLGMINNVVLHKHKSVIRFNDYGAGQNVAAARALLLGKQAMVVAYGDGGGGRRFSWKEETDDYGNEPTVAAGIIFGLTKTRFNKRDFGVVSIDTAAKDPNAA
jgi:N4-gp56 family major capsid protein